MLTMIDPILFFDNIIANRLDEFVAFKFETACKQFLLREAFAKKQACPSEIARYWGHNHEIKQEVEIDIVKKDQQGLIVYECKWTNDIIRKSDYDNLINKSKFLKPYAFGSFSKTGYSSDAKSYFNHTYQLDDIYDATL
jgi:AAA+ ATPase superfamily predicted ATPase